MDSIIFIPLCGAVLLSFWISLVEATYLTARPTPLRLASEGGDKRAITALKITNEKTQLVSTTTFVDTFSNVVIATCMGLILFSLLGNYGWIYDDVVGSVAIMVFLYLLPKAIGIENSGRMAITLAQSSELLLRVLSPVAVPLTSFASHLSRRLMVDRSGTDTKSLVNEFEDFLILLERAGHVAPDAGKVIRTALSSSKSVAGDFATPLNEIVSIGTKSSVSEALKVMGESGHPHLPIRDETTLSFVGAVTFGSLSPAMANGRFSDNIMTYSVEPARVDIKDATVTVMERMEEAKVTMAFIDQAGIIFGMATLTDILEVVLGIKV
jgi:putative hemolysin